jgi:hypothetical protein
MVLPLLIIVSAPCIVLQRRQNELCGVPAGNGAIRFDHRVSILVCEIGYPLDDAPDRVIGRGRSSKQTDPLHISSNDRVFTRGYSPDQLVTEASAVDPCRSGQRRPDMDSEEMTTPSLFPEE